MRSEYRAACFGKPVGPWRSCLNKARADLVDRDLGSYDEWGWFWIIVPGEMQSRCAVAQSRAA